MCRNFTPLVAVMFLIQSATAFADCEGGGVADPTAVSARKVSPEYALGEPKVLEVEDAGEVKQLPYIKVGARAIFEGDIILGDANQLEFAAQSGPIKLQLRRLAPPSELTPFGYVARSVLSGAQKWPQNTIPYVIDPNLTSGDVILRAMRAWSNSTKLNFVERTNKNADQYPNYIYFTVGSDPIACVSEGVGMLGGRQNVELVTGCEFGQIVHEIGHVIGLHHEQNRGDRDNIVRVELANILKGYDNQFKKNSIKYKDFGAYDLDSIMHYNQYAFTCNGKATIVPIKPLPDKVQIGQRDHISAGDVAAINAIYK